MLSLSGIDASRAGTFTVIDDRAADEVSEVSRLYIDGNLAAVFKLGADIPTLTKQVVTPEGRVNHNYALCGHITIINARGEQETHEVSSEGVLHRPDGRVFEALGASDFTDFYLRDMSDPTAVDHRPGRAPVCAAPIT